jgi:5-methylcytosine-specific restriction endonuclease McrA
MKRNYADPVYKAWRMSVYRRDKFTCQMPKCGSKRRIQAHHIRPWAKAAALRYAITNGITLCRTCHDKINSHEEAYMGVFTTIVMSKIKKKNDGKKEK